MANLFKTMFGGIKRDFTPKLIPGLLRDAKRKAAQADHPAEERIDRAEFARRYRNLQICIWVSWAMAALAAIQAIRIDSWLFALGAALAALLMFTSSLGMIFRASVARGVWRTWGQSRLPRQVSLKDYVKVFVRHPSELLPLNLPKVDQERGISE